MATGRSPADPHRPPKVATCSCGPCAAHADARASSKCREPTSAMAVNEPGLGSSADHEIEEGIDRGFERTDVPLYLGE